MQKIKIVLAGALVFSFWFALSWMLPWHDPLTYKPMPNGEEISSLLAQSIDQSGTYAYPGPPSGSSISSSSMEETITKHLEGPIAVLWFKTEGENPMNLLTFLFSFMGHIIVLVIVINWIIDKRASSFSAKTAQANILLMLGIGLIIAIQSYGALVIWQHMALDYALVMSLEQIIGWILTSLVINILIKSRLKKSEKKEIQNG